MQFRSKLTLHDSKKYIERVAQDKNMRILYFCSFLSFIL